MRWLRACRHRTGAVDSGHRDSTAAFFASSRVTRGRIEAAWAASSRCSSAVASRPGDRVDMHASCRRRTCMRSWWAAFGVVVVRWDELAFAFLGDGETVKDRLTYAELDRRARALAGLLRARDLSGAPVLLLYPPGLDYITAFFGCVYAGAIAVPAYPPHRNRSLDRLRSIVRDARANEYRFSSLIIGIATSTPFQMRRAE